MSSLLISFRKTPYKLKLVWGDFISDQSTNKASVAVEESSIGQLGGLNLLERK